MSMTNQLVKLGQTPISRREMMRRSRRLFSASDDAVGSQNNTRI
jgi:hypothetical protein